ncbi:MAG: murein transglycosylase domain-containing protein [Hydrogenovibrio sp.]|uniref:murein transglycosylase domain-containing protein n=1 Tax=Hydrogenovibrio sp. TaxID=2065821 RepID=UPI0028708353|nr:murein transglycosylase domain-containing protein [Hydrogenovibrio sp.]MDR9499358.1 murein transglycosylase domain-containing protein [Hydrogenovibrio sp.]
MTKMAYHSLLAFGLLLLFMGGAASSFPQAMATLFAPQVEPSTKLYPSRAEIQAQLSPSLASQPVAPAPKSKTPVTPQKPTHARAMPSASVTPASLGSDQSRAVKTASAPKASQKPAVLATPSKKTNASNVVSADAVPVLIEYQDELVLEFPKQLATNKHLKRALSRLFLAPQRLTDRALLDKTRLDLSKRPYYYRRVLDHQGKAIRYPAQAYAYAEHLLNQNAKTVSDPEGQFLLLTIPLTDYGLSDQAKTYQAWVEEYARQFQVPPSLVYAVMETESSFNPLAVSRSNAIGLMQIKAGAAGRDVYELIDARAGQPTIKELFDSQNNIRMGTAYLSLLKHDYLGGIEDEKIKQMVTISSYNGGMRTVLGLFGDTPEKAIQQLNRLSPQNVYRTLRYQHQSDETRRYLDKVLQAEVRYRDLLQTA